MSTQRKTVRLNDDGLIPFTDLVTDLQRRIKLSNKEINLLIQDLKQLGQTSRTLLEEGLTIHNQSVEELVPQLVVKL